MIVKSLHKSLLAAGLLASLGLTAVAQTPAAAPVAPAAQAQSQAQRGDPARMEQRHAKQQELRKVRAERRLAALKLKLAVSPAQEGAWTTWTSAMKPVPHQRPARGEFAALTTPERIDRMKAMQATRAAEMDRRGEATKAFYTALSTDQKKVFDAESLNFGHGGKGNRGKGGHHGNHHRG